MKRIISIVICICLVILCGCSVDVAGVHVDTSLSDENANCIHKTDEYVGIIDYKFDTDCVLDGVDLTGVVDYKSIVFYKCDLVSGLYINCFNKHSDLYDNYPNIMFSSSNPLIYVCILCDKAKDTYKQVLDNADVNSNDYRLITRYCKTPVLLYNSWSNSQTASIVFEADDEMVYAECYSQMSDRDIIDLANSIHIER